MDFSTQFTQIKDKIAQSNSILIVLPKDVTIDKLAAALSLYLSLQQANKQSWIVSTGTLKVSHSNLYGIGDISDTFPKSTGGNLILTLDGVVDDQGKVPALEKLDWYPEGNSLNLVFHVIPGQSFEPKNISTMRAGSDFDLIIMVGASQLIEIGDLFMQHTDAFSKSTKVNIDINSNNNFYGEINVVDNTSPSLSQLVLKLLGSCGLPVDEDIATNILSGIYDSTHNLTSKVNPETFMVVAQALQSGGKLPAVQVQSATQPTKPKLDIKPFIQPTPEKKAPDVNAEAPIQEEAKPVEEKKEEKKEETQQVEPEQPSKEHPVEEVPSGEFVTSTGETAKPTPDWLTPKVYKGRSLG